MVRTRVREDQGNDSDFLSEEEGSERFIFRDGYGTNNTNLLLDGYIVIKDVGVPGTPAANHIGLYYSGSDFYTINSSGTQTSLTATAPATGTFTPTFNLGGSAQSTSYALGSYSKIGKAVTIVISIAFTKSGTGALTIGNLPFATQNTTNLRQGLVISKYEGFTASAVYGRITTLQATIEPNTIIIKIQKSVGDSGTDLLDTNLTSTGTIEITGTYLSN